MTPAATVQPGYMHDGPRLGRLRGTTSLPGRAAPRWPVVLAAVVPLLLGTVVVFAVGFGVLSACTDTYSCTVTGCAPCRPASSWLNGGWAAQGVLLVAAVVLAVAARRGLRPAVARTVALGVVGLSVLALVVTTELAVTSY